MKLTQGLRRAVQLKPDATATVFGARRRSWREVQDRVARLAAGLVARGLGLGDRIAVIALNSDRYIELYLAVWWAGGVIVPGNTRWALAEHVYAIQDSGARFLIVDKTFAQMAGPLTEACALEATFFMDDGVAPEGTVGVDDLIAVSSPMADASGEGDDLAGLFYTGGTTGRSKGVMLSHRSLVSNFLCSQATHPMQGDAVFLHSPPMFHLADVAMVIGATIVGGTHVVVPFFSPENVVNAVAAERVTDAVLVPTMFGMLAEYLRTHDADLSSMRQIAYGASPTSETLLQQAMAMFPNAQFRQAYGQTELSPIATLLLPDFHKSTNGRKPNLRSAGYAIVGVDVKIADEFQNEVARGEVGEILVRSPGGMLGYWNQPELTRQTIVDGWVRTGDAGYMDDEGFVYLVDRVKDMIVSGGENVYSAEVENALAAHSQVVECAVIGVPDDKWGERVHAIVRLRGEASAEELIAHCRDLIATYKCPRSVEIRTEALPLSGAGKILKTELRKPHWPEGARRIN
ncbi:MAG TPA: long-chain-fatty-acid--CoA ligase [Rhizomicrobium sp.]|jgi:long-chain acyl-CoA synthetase